MGRLRAHSSRSPTGGHFEHSTVTERLVHEAPHRREGADRADAGRSRQGSIRFRQSSTDFSGCLRFCLRPHSGPSPCLVRHGYAQVFGCEVGRQWHCPLPVSSGEICWREKRGELLRTSRARNLVSADGGRAQCRRTSGPVGRPACFALRLTPQTAPWFSEQIDRALGSWQLWKDWWSFSRLVPGRLTVAQSSFCSCLPSQTTAATTFAINDPVTTQYPLCANVMELSAQMDMCKARVDLSWTPRERNEEANDAVSNFSFDGFSLDMRVRIDLHSIQWQVPPELLQHGYVLEEPQRAQREKHKVGRSPKPKVERKEVRFRASVLIWIAKEVAVGRKQGVWLEQW